MAVTKVLLAYPRFAASPEGDEGGPGVGAGEPLRRRELVRRGAQGPRRLLVEGRRRRCGRRRVSGRRRWRRWGGRLV